MIIADFHKFYSFKDIWFRILIYWRWFTEQNSQTSEIAVKIHIPSVINSCRSINITMKCKVLASANSGRWTAFSQWSHKFFFLNWVWPTVNTTCIKMDSKQFLCTPQTSNNFFVVLKLLARKVKMRWVNYNYIWLC